MKTALAIYSAIVFFTVWFMWPLVSVWGAWFF